MSDDPQKDLFKRAAEVASVVPEPMQDAAFRRALDMLQEEEGSSPGKKRSPRKPSSPRPRPSRPEAETESDNPAELLIHGINRTDYPQVGNASKTLERALHVLKIAKDDFGIDGLSANEIARVLTEKFRNRTTRQRVGQVLDPSNLVDRYVPRGQRGARYRIMDPGERYLINPPADEEKPTKRGQSKSRAPRRSARAKDSGSGAKKAVGRKGRVGPGPSIDELLQDGYLDEPRTIGAIRERLDSKKGRAFKVTDLSPALTRMIRNGVLDRDKNEDGQYEYQRK